MRLFKKRESLHFWLDLQQKNGRKIGFVPTMGALHEGHITLIKASKKENDITVASIFVNPTQFNDSVDFDKYPKTIENDILLLEGVACDVLFLPSVAEMYPNGVVQNENYELGNLETLLEGKYRPGHYQGVCMIVHRLLEIVSPDNLYLGQKDYQQCMIINKLVELIGLKEKININIEPTLREYDGLAMSSRNMRLTEEERKMAPEIFKSLSYIKENFNNKDLSQLVNEGLSALEANGFKVDYVEIADAGTLLPIRKTEKDEKAIALIAAFLNDIRLIDNILLN